MERPSRARRTLPPRLLAAAVATAGAVLIAAFLAAGFPAERLAPRIRAELESATGAQVRMDSLDLGLSVGGLQLTAVRLALRWPEGTALDFDRAAIRPAWSFDWLRGAPAWHLDLSGPAGGFRGTLGTGERTRIDGNLRGAVLERIPQAWTGSAQLSGRMDAEIDVFSAEDSWNGTIEVRSSDGSFALPLLPIGVPFEQIDATLQLGGDTMATLESFVLEGPLLAGTASGTLGAAASAARAPLRIEVDLDVRDPNVRPLLEQQGIALDAAGRIRFEVGGTLAAPVVMPPPRARGRRQ